ncbi:MAG: hypothetical protein HY652_14535 [Acidobacteria bacterium]|nr:hypothetical protein [Acidobacteriota bacterium]
MILASGFSFGAYQAATFYASLQLTVNKVLPQLLNGLSDVLDGDPIALPVPAEAPPEVPRILLGNKNRSIRFDISHSRADVRWQRPGNELQGWDLRRFCDFAQRAFGLFHEATQAKPGRLALIVNRFQPDEKPGRALASHFCRPALLSNQPGKKGPLNRPENFELHAHKTFELGPFLVNSWVRVKTGLKTEAGERTKIILVEQDLNTLAEKLPDTEFSENEIREFYRLAVPELEVIIRLYFPDTDQGEDQNEHSASARKHGGNWNV